MLWFSTPDADFDSVSAELQRRIKLLDQEVIVHKRIATSLEMLEPEVSNRIYRLAVVDVFVEKAIHLLTLKTNQYKWTGYGAFFVAFCIICYGAYLASKQANIGGGKSPINRKTNKKRGRK